MKMKLSSNFHGNGRTELCPIKFAGEENYLNLKIFLFGHDGSETIELNSGTYKYNFMVNLPKHLPGTLKGFHGGVEYKVEALLNVLNGLNKKVEVPFTVVRQDNLNNYPELKEPQKRENKRSVLSIHGTTDYCSISAKIPRSGYIAGELIPLVIVYVNKSGVKVLKTKVKLQRIFTFKSSTPEINMKKEFETVIEGSIGGAKGKEIKTIDCYLEIPKDIPNSNARFCQVVQVSYVLNIESIFNGYNQNMELIIPITVGSIAIGDLCSYNETADEQEAPVVPQEPVHQYQFVAPSAPSLIDKTDDDLREFKSLKIFNVFLILSCFSAVI